MVSFSIKQNWKNPLCDIGPKTNSRGHTFRTIDVTFWFGIKNDLYLAY